MLKPTAPALFLTDGGEAYRKTIGGIKKLSGAELFNARHSPDLSRGKFLQLRGGPNEVE